MELKSKMFKETFEENINKKENIENNETKVENEVFEVVDPVEVWWI
jgi:hypothetical protein